MLKDAKLTRVGLSQTVSVCSRSGVVLLRNDLCLAHHGPLRQRTYSRALQHAVSKKATLLGRTSVAVLPHLLPAVQLGFRKRDEGCTTQPFHDELGWDWRLRLSPSRPFRMHNAGPALGTMGNCPHVGARHDSLWLEAEFHARRVSASGPRASGSAA